MGHFDEVQAHEDALREIAIEVAVRTGLLQRCPLHEDCFDPLQHDYEAAYKLANFLITKGDPLAAAFEGNRKHLTDLIQDICTDFGDCCYSCAKNAAS